MLKWFRDPTFNGHEIVDEIDETKTAKPLVLITDLDKIASKHKITSEQRHCFIHTKKSCVIVLLEAVTCMAAKEF